MLLCQGSTLICYTVIGEYWMRIYITQNTILVTSKRILKTHFLNLNQPKFAGWQKQCLGIFRGLTLLSIGSSILSELITNFGTELTKKFLVSDFIKTTYTNGMKHWLKTVLLLSIIVIVRDHLRKSYFRK